MSSNLVIHAIYNDDDILMDAVKQARKAHHHIEEVYTPFPVHGLDKAMGLAPTRLAICAFIYGCIGLTIAITLMNFIMIQDWPQDIGGKPSFNYIDNIVTIAGNLVANSITMGAGEYEFSSTRMLFASTSSAAFTVGQRIVVTGMSALGYNNTWTVKTCTATTITADGSATGAGTGGVIKPLNSVASFDSANFTISSGWVSIKTGSIQVLENKTEYDLNSLWANVSESGAAIEIRKVYHDNVPAIARYFDPFAGTGMGTYSMLQEFGFTGYSTGVSFLLMPLHADILRFQAIELNDMIRRSAFSFRTYNNKLKITPIPTYDYKLYFEYILVNDRDQAVSGSVAGSVSDYSNACLLYTSDAADE